MQETESRAQAIGILGEGEYTCVVEKDGAVIHKLSGAGVSPLLKLYKDMPASLTGACVFDTVIGKAAAMILISGKAGFVYGKIMSRTALKILNEHKIRCGYGELAEYIINRAGDGMCPMERAVLNIDNPGEGVKAILEFIGRARQK